MSSCLFPSVIFLPTKCISPRFPSPLLSNHLRLHSCLHLLSPPPPPPHLHQLPCTIHHLLNRWYLSPVSGVCAKYGSEKTHSRAILDAIDTEISAHQLWYILVFYSCKLNSKLCICCDSWSSFVADEIGALKLLILVRWKLLISRCQALLVEILSSACNHIPEMVFFMFMCVHTSGSRGRCGDLRWGLGRTK